MIDAGFPKYEDEDEDDNDKRRYAAGVLGLGPFPNNPDSTYSSSFLRSILAQDTFYFSRDLNENGVSGDIAFSQAKFFKGYQLGVPSKAAGPVFVPIIGLPFWSFAVESKCITIKPGRCPLRVQAPRAMIVNQSLDHNVVSKAFALAYTCAFDCALKAVGESASSVKSIVSTLGSKTTYLITRQYTCEAVHTPGFIWPAVQFDVIDINGQKRTLLFNGAQGTFFGEGAQKECRLAFAYAEVDPNPEHWTLGWPGLNISGSHKGEYPQFHVERVVFKKKSSGNVAEPPAVELSFSLILRP